jgi:hypothetical protein
MMLLLAYLFAPTLGEPAIAASRIGDMKIWPTTTPFSSSS